MARRIPSVGKQCTEVCECVQCLRQYDFVPSVVPRSGLTLVFPSQSVPVSLQLSREGEGIGGAAQSTPGKQKLHHL